MSSQALLLLPAIAALIYVFAALFIKKAITAGCGQPQVNLLVNLLPALVFQLLWLRSGSINWAETWRPATCGVTFFLGQIFTFLALRNGEVSVTTPLLGTKVVFTAIFSAMIFGQALALRWWLGALACSFGVLLVTGATWRTLAPRLLRKDAIFSLGAAVTFGLTDVLVQRWTHFLGIPTFVAFMFGFTGVLAVVFFAPGILLGNAGIPRSGLGPLAVGAALCAVQILGMAIALGLHDSATAVNVVYGSRAVWSVALAWMLARLFRADEAKDPPEVMARRLAGSLLVFGAVLAVLL